MLLDVRRLAAHSGLADDIETACYLLESAFQDRIRRLAIVHGPERDKSASFFETYCRNRGLDIRGSRKGEDAVAWACAVQRGARSRGEGLSMRIGLNYGEVIVDAEADVYG